MIKIPTSANPGLELSLLLKEQRKFTAEIQQYGQHSSLFERPSLRIGKFLLPVPYEFGFLDIEIKEKG